MGCSESEGIANQSDNDATFVNINITRSEQDVVTCANDFSLNLLKELAGSNEADFCVSPYSAYVTLSMLANGIDHNEGVINLIGFDNNISIEDINSLNKKMLSTIPSIDPNSVCKIANSIWICNQLEFNDNFIEKINEFYNGNAFSSTSSIVDHAPVKEWVCKETSGFIRQEDIEILDSPWIIANAVYFSGKWKNPFDAQKTGISVFNVSDSDKINVNMMNTTITNTRKYKQNPDCQVASLDYGTGNFSMILILPSAGITVDDFISTLSSSYSKELTSFNNLPSSGIPSFYNLDIKMPKFEYSANSNLMDHIKAISKSPIDLKCDLMVKNSSFYATKINQTIKLEVNEEGTKAAGVTQIGMYTESAPVIEDVSLVLDRPFIYAIQENSTGLVLFTGIYRGI